MKRTRTEPGYVDLGVLQAMLNREARQKVIRNETRAQMRRGSRNEKMAVELAVLGYGIDDIHARLPTIDLYIIRKLVLGIE